MEQQIHLLPMNQRQGLMHKYAYITFVVILYWLVSISMVFINKDLLSNYNLNAPIFITWFQSIVSVAICLILKGLSKVNPNQYKFPEGNPMTVETIKKILPLSILFTAMIVGNNLCLKYVNISFYYIGRSLTTVFNVIFTYIILGEKTSAGTITCCLVIIFGFWLGVDQENTAGSLSLVGTLFGVFASLAVSLYSIYTKKALPYVRQQIWLLSYYNNVYSVFLFLPLMLFNGEYENITNFDKISNSYFWFTMVFSGICGFAIGYVTMLQIQVTTPLTHNISGTAKACVQTILATNWNKEQKSWLWWLGNFIVLGGSAAYARIKQLCLEKKHMSYRGLGSS